MLSVSTTLAGSGFCSSILYLPKLHRIFESAKQKRKLAIEWTFTLPETNIAPENRPSQ